MSFGSFASLGSVASMPTGRVGGAVATALDHAAAVKQHAAGAAQRVAGHSESFLSMTSVIDPGSGAQSSANSADSAAGSSDGLNTRSVPDIIQGIGVMIDELDPGDYIVTHTRKGKIAHHSHIRIRTARNEPVFNIGLFYVDGEATIMCRMDERHGYRASDSYAPNPLKVSNAKLKQAYDFAVGECGGKYHIYSNNCQKFARILMTQLGAIHQSGVLQR